MNALPEIEAVRAALRPTGEAQAVIREVRDVDPQSVSVTSDGFEVIALLRTTLGSAHDDIVRVFAAEDQSEKNRQNGLAELKAALRIVEALRPVTR